MKARQRLPAAGPHLERALDALAVLRREPRGRHRVDQREPRVHGGPAERGGFGVDRARTAASAAGMASSRRTAP
jgi:hypothetical protein